MQYSVLLSTIASVAVVEVEVVEVVEVVVPMLEGMEVEVEECEQWRGEEDMEVCYWGGEEVEVVEVSKFEQRLFYWEPESGAWEVEGEGEGEGEGLEWTDRSRCVPLTALQHLWLPPVADSPSLSHRWTDLASTSSRSSVVLR